MRIAAVVYRLRWIVLAAWLLAAMAVELWIPSRCPQEQDAAPLLPAEAPSSRAADALGRHFPHAGGLSEAVLVFERRDGKLTEADRQAIEQAARRGIRPEAGPASSADLAGVTVRSPGSLELPPNPLTGRPIGPNLLLSDGGQDGQAALVAVHIPADFITVRSDRVVRHIRAVLAGMDLPGGLEVSVSGSGGFGHDYAAAAKQSHRRTAYVTVTAVIVMLLIVFRSPLAPLVPLAAISLAAMVAMGLLSLGRSAGLHVATAEKIFAFVLLYGAGVDYSLLLMSRYSEGLAESPCSLALPAALRASFPAILASAGTDTIGLLMLSFATFGAFRTAGPAIAIALSVALLASLTLTPALMGIAGGKLFWPSRRAVAAGAQPGQAQGRWFWRRLARLVTARPGATLILTLGLLAIPAVGVVRIRLVYDTLASVRADRPDGVGNAAAGVEAIRRHWPPGWIGPAQIILEADHPLDEARWERLARRLSQAVAERRGISEVRSFAAPLGLSAPPAANALARTAGGQTVRSEYLGGDGRAMRLVVMLEDAPFSPGAMSAARGLARIVEAEAAGAGFAGRVYLAGPTAEMLDIESVIGRDFRLIALLVMGVIYLMVVLLLRDGVLSGFMVFSTLVSYAATLGITGWVFQSLLGAAGLDWKVLVFLFVVMVAVGQDYNIFLAARLAEEARRLPPRRATRKALVHTGPVISSCGLIMAATLGSLAAGELVLMKQLGLALALGMLIDTFVVRPLLLPAFVAATGRTGRLPGFRRSAPSSLPE